MEIRYEKIPEPKRNCYCTPVDLSARTMEEHRNNVLLRMKEEQIDTLIIYADREHGANFAYLTGFEPRFEEALLVLHKSGKCYLLLGNENLKMAQYSFIKGKVIHVPHFSLPYQPMETGKTLMELLAEAGISDGSCVGCVGWKLFTGELENNTGLLDIPAFIAERIKKINPRGTVVNASSIFVGAADGLRTRVNANEIAHYEYGAGLASSRVLDALDQMEPGMTEMEVAGMLTAFGQPTTVTTICASGERFTNAVVFPRANKIKKGDRFSITLGLRGGLTSRAAYVAGTEADLPLNERNYIEEVAIPYYKASIRWLEMLSIGTVCGDIYKAIEEILPKERYHWILNPGHYTGDDEWSSSPIYPNSEVEIKSGMLLQLDIIPSVPGYGGVGAEDGIAVADKALQAEIEKNYPETWLRFQRRKTYLKDVLGIRLKEEILPMSDTLGYLRPFLLKKDYALRKINKG